MKYKRSDFPKDFLFGVATSAYQIEGHGFGGAGETHWDSFARTPGNVVRAENGDLACDHYHRFGEDFDLVRDGGVDCYRFSTSWARVLPEGGLTDGWLENRLIGVVLKRDGDRAGGDHQVLQRRRRGRVGIQAELQPGQSSSLLSR